jgi:Uma2 family endonuclease
MSAGTIPVTPTIPPLRDGERLSPEEFMRRYEATPEKFKAELLDGVVYVSSPTTFVHASPHSHLMTWLGTYEAFTPGTSSGDNGTIRLSAGSIPQPDAFLRINEANGGQSRVNDDGYVAGPVELAAEVAVSSTHRDRTVKLPIYQRSGIREYILWRVEDRTIEWYTLRSGGYELLQADSYRIVRSEVFPGLWLEVEAMIRGDMGSALRTLQQGLNSAEHVQFVERLQRAVTSSS